MDVSVVIPAYNAERFLARAIESVLGQTCPPMELIVVEDGSTDGTSEVARQFGDRVRFFHQENAGAAAARNRGIRESQGDWVAFLDADDWWTADHVEAQHAIVVRHPDLVWVSGGCENVYSDGLRLRSPDGVAHRRLLEDGVFDDFYEASLAGVTFFTCAMLIRRAVLVEVGLFDESMVVGEDRDLWYRIADRYSPVGFVDRPVFFYDWGTPESLTKLLAVQVNANWRLVEKHVPADPEARQQMPAAKAAYFRRVLARETTRLFISRGATWMLRRLISTYGDMLSWSARWMARLACWVPPPVLRLVSRLYAATVVPCKNWLLRRARQAAAWRALWKRARLPRGGR